MRKEFAVFSALVLSVCAVTANACLMKDKKVDFASGMVMYCCDPCVSQADSLKLLSGIGSQQDVVIRATELKKMLSSNQHALKDLEKADSDQSVTIVPNPENKSCKSGEQAFTFSYLVKKS